MITSQQHGHPTDHQTQQPTHYEQHQEQETEQRSRTTPDTGHYAEQTTRHDQQETPTKRSRERSNDSHLCITIRRCCLRRRERPRRVIATAVTRPTVDLQCKIIPAPSGWWSSC
jgi:hypothetical protein